ncbi:class I SAM-dependent methyltransferase [Arsenophonus symbiont of Ornithomya chloropus]|uniref:class I SAM-dependent methyltransferase n=1 Tax=Arsenophonus symbiont of Ornithomya chloropus TaxID=634121 RepID=UPI0032B1C89F
MSVQLICEPGVSKNSLYLIANQWKITHTPNALMALVLTPEHLQLKKINEPKLGGVYVDFLSPELQFRRKVASYKNEAIAKAVGIKKTYFPTIFDATAGFGTDAFILASLGCKVFMFERNPVVAALLENGLQRAYLDSKIGYFLRDRMILLHILSDSPLSNLSFVPDVVYLDPMYPYRKKKCFNKKKMRLLQCLVGSDEDATDLLISAMRIAKYRVIVKRPNYATSLMIKEAPKGTIKTKKHRFDIYLSYKN